MLTKPFTEVDVLGCFVQPIVPLNLIMVKQLTVKNDGKVANNQLFRLLFGGSHPNQQELAQMPQLFVETNQFEEIILKTDKPGFNPLLVKSDADPGLNASLKEANEWLSTLLGLSCTLRPVEGNRAQTLLVVSYGSLNALNDALKHRLTVENFGANLVVDAEAWTEFQWGSELKVDNVQFMVGETAVHTHLDVVELWKEESELRSEQKAFRPNVLGTDRRLRFGRMVQPVTAGTITRFMYAA
jgi:uncharacterized protein YcbX